MFFRNHPFQTAPLGVLLLFMMLSISVSADLIPQEDSVLDTQQQLHWLRLDATFGMTPSQALAANPGWQLPSHAQFRNLINQFFPGYFDETGTGSMVATTDFNDTRLLGDDFLAAFGEYAVAEISLSLGLYQDPQDNLRVGGVEAAALFQPVEYSIYRDDQDDYEAQRNSGLPWLGVWLVQPTGNPVTRIALPDAALPVITANGSDSSAMIFSGFQRATDLQFVSQATPGDTVSMAVSIEPEGQHFGLSANVFVAIEVLNSGQILWLTPTGLVVFNGIDMHPLTTIESLQSSNYIEIFRELVLTQNEAGEYRFYVGYVAQNGSEIRYTGSPVPLAVIP